MSKSRDIEMARYLAGEMTMKEEIAFLSEAEKSQEQLSELNNMEKNWKYFDQNPSRKDWNSGEAWGQLHQRLESEGLLEDQAVSPIRGRFTPLLRIAASIALILAIGIPALYYGVIRDSASESMRHHLAQEGVVKERDVVCNFFHEAQILDWFVRKCYEFLWVVNNPAEAGKQGKKHNNLQYHKPNL